MKDIYLIITIVVWSSSIILGANQNKVEENVDGVGGWGGLCKCPNGQEYLVGDNVDGCATLACDGGAKVNCNKWEDDRWKHRKVTCLGNVSIYFKRYLCPNICSTIDTVITSHVQKNIE